jgi:hypothetical protein
MGIRNRRLDRVPKSSCAASGCTGGERLGRAGPGYPKLPDRLRSYFCHTLAAAAGTCRQSGKYRRAVIESVQNRVLLVRYGLSGSADKVERDGTESRRRGEAFPLKQAACARYSHKLSPSLREGAFSDQGIHSIDITDPEALRKKSEYTEKGYALSYGEMTPLPRRSHSV